jgi:hypothetical protein
MLLLLLSNQFFVISICPVAIHPLLSKTFSSSFSIPHNRRSERELFIPLLIVR